MTVHVSIPFDDTEKAELDRIARHQNLTVEALIRRLVEQRFEYEAWFRAEVQKGLDDVAAGRLLSHEEVVARMDALFQELGSDKAVG
jgi:predicted transcriptional regulator